MTHAAEATDAAEPVRTRRRLIPMAAALLLLGAALAGGSSLLVWARATWLSDLQGEFDTSATGGDAAQALIPLAVAALAALGAVLASRGWLRKAIGVLIGLAGVALIWQSTSVLTTAPIGALTIVDRPATLIGTPKVDVLGPLLAIVGGVLLIAAGVLVVLAPATRPTLGSRYERGSAPTVGTGRDPQNPDAADSSAKGSPAAHDATLDSDRDAVAMWKALDARTDPTVETSNGSTSRAGNITDGPPSDGVANRPLEER